jgi:hypothetical protein
MGLLRPLLRLVKARRFTSSVITSRGYKSRWSPLHTTTSSCTIHHFLLTSFPTSKKKEREREREDGKKEKKKGGITRISGSVASTSFSIHGGTRLDPFQGYAGSPGRPSGPRVHDGDGACGLPCARGPRVPRTRKRIRGDLCSILRARIWCAIALVPLLAIAAI